MAVAVHAQACWQASHFNQQTTCRLCWLTLCANLTGLRGAQTAGQTLFLGVSVTASPVEMSIRINIQVEKVVLPSVGGPEQKVGGRMYMLCLSKAKPLFLPLDVRAPSSQAFRLGPGLRQSAPLLRPLDED